VDLTTSCEVVVVGGGPAGATAGTLLASWGHDVVVVAGRARTTSLVETLPPSARAILERTGQLEAVEGAGFVPARGTTARWAGESYSVRFGEQAGWQVRRDRLDALLLQRAEAAGARVLRDTTALAVHPVAQAGAGDGTALGRVVVASAGRQGRVDARWVVDATGRAGLVAYRGDRRITGAPTLALAQLWQTGRGWRLADPTDTTVESYEGGWVWSIPASGNVRCVAAMVDRATSSLTEGGDPATRHRLELERTELHRALLARATPIGHAWICGATSYAAARCVGAGWIAVGDAGSFLDPLSSYGVKKALASAWLGAVALNTALTRPEMTDAALRLHDAREREAAVHFDRAALRFHAAAARVHPGPFWSVRAATPARPPVETDDGDALVPDSRAVLADPGVRRAFERLRSSERVRLRPVPGVRRIQSPAVRGREVVLEDRVISPAAPRGLGMLQGVDLAALVDSAARPADIPDLFEAYTKSRGPVPLPDFLAGVSVLIANGILHNEA
jgi:flavin-dependent dehydrogenase